MDNVTLLIAITASLIILIKRPAVGLCIFILVLLLYPGYLVIPIEGLKFSAQRIVVLVLFLCSVLDKNLLSKFHFHFLDFLVLASYIFGFITLSSSMQFEDYFKTYLGTFLDSTFVYFLVRLIIIDKKSFELLIKFATIALCVNAVLGIRESITGLSPYLKLYLLCPWNEVGKLTTLNERSGFFRACGSFSVHILFGLSFVIFTPLLLILRKCQGIWKKLVYLFLLLAILGCMSSMSSGPLLGLITVSLCLFLKCHPRYIKSTLLYLVLMIIFVNFLSNRSFFYVVGRFTFDEGNSWYRARLMDVAIEKLPDYWVSGYGMKDPGWGPILDGRKKTDLCNAYVLQAVQFGLGGLILFIGILIYSMVRIYRYIHKSTDKWGEEAAWLVGGALISLIVVFFSVGLFGKLLPLFNILLGLVGFFQAKIYSAPHKRIA